jgi:hypothetical protein
LLSQLQDPFGHHRHGRSVLRLAPSLHHPDGGHGNHPVLHPLKGNIMYDITIINAIDTVADWNFDAAFSCVSSLAALRYRD